jgi:hypothetical protein
MYSLEEIYSDFATKAMSLGFGEVLKHIGDRPLRVATVCSGTESPIMAMELLQTGTSLHSSCLFFLPRIRCGPGASPKRVLGRACQLWSHSGTSKEPLARFGVPTQSHVLFPLHKSM